MLSVLRFASLHASAGSLAAFARLGVGRRAGLWGGWVYLLGISYCIPSALLGSAIYLDSLLTPWLGAESSGIRVGAFTVLLGIATWAAAFRGVKLSTLLMLIIEAASLAVMALLMVTGMTRAHAWLDHAQIGLSGVAVLILSVYPPPPRPYSYVIFAFFGSMLVGMTLSVWRARGAPQPVQSPGGSVSL